MKARRKEWWANPKDDEYDQSIGAPTLVGFRAAKMEQAQVPKRFTSKGLPLGLRPGFAVDLGAKKNIMVQAGT